MPADWLKIKQARPDITDYLIHWTRGIYETGQRISPLIVLMSIIECGFLKPSFAPRNRITVGGRDNTIKGTQPAVCFTEQPLDSFIKSCDNLSNRYHPYAIAVRKDRLFEYGGRPVSYGDENLLNKLPDEYKYLWVHYQPIPSEGIHGYPLDWTHEREWRALAVKYSYGALGMWTEEGVPLLLPPQISEKSKPIWYLPWIIVRDKSEVDNVRQYIGTFEPYTGSNGILKLYFKLLPKVPIVSLDEVKDRVNAQDPMWCRLDTLPMEELDASITARFVRLGWRELKQA